MSFQQIDRNAYLVLAHEDVQMLNILIKRLINTGYVYIHIDRASLMSIEEVVSGPKIKVIKEMKINWGGFSMCQATMLLADQALKDGSTRLTLLSGVSFPIVSDTKILEVFSSGREFSGTWIVDLDSQSKTFKKRFTTRHLTFHRKQDFLGRSIRKVSRFCCSLLPRINPEKDLRPLRLTSGSQWWSVKAETYVEAMRLATTYNHIQKYFKKIECSDESFFGTLFHHVSPDLVGHGTTYVKWTGKGGPKRLSMEDLKFQISDEIFLFARKIHSNETGLIDLLRQK